MSKPSFMVGILSLTLFLAVAMSANRWEQATATFYGGPDGGETFDGACGYRKVCGYGVQNTALSTALFNNGLACGACFEIQCYKSKWCHPGKIRVTATNFCPGGGVGWCNPPNKHFDLSQPMFLKIGEYKAGVIPVIYQRVPCLKSGGIKFELKGNPWFLRVLVYNVGGVGDVHQVSIKGSKTGWIQMSRSWGQVWDTGYQLLGQSLSFQVTTSDGKMVQSDNVAPAFWQFSQTYEGKQF